MKGNKKISENSYKINECSKDVDIKENIISQIEELEKLDQSTYDKNLNKSKFGGFYQGINNLLNFLKIDLMKSTNGLTKFSGLNNQQILNDNCPTSPIFSKNLSDGTAPTKVIIII